VRDATEIQVLVVDDHDLIRQGIARMLEDETDMKVGGLASSGEEALEFLANNAVDIVLMDVKMPGMGGIEATQRITQNFPKTRVVAMSSIDIGVIPSQILSAGALGFITKSAAVDELLHAIRTVANGQHYVNESVARQLALDPFNRKKKRMFEKLSQRELQISMLLSDGQKVSRISELLELSPKTVYSYRYRIFEKLGIRSDVELTILAMRNGLCESSEDMLEFGERRDRAKLG
jgi:two-component system, NarL family, invasion response regulator UvrY